MSSTTSRDDTLPTHTPATATVNSDGSPKDTLTDQSELQEFTRTPYADLTVDSEPDHLRDSLIDYDHLAALTRPQPSEIEVAQWEDLRSLPAPPPREAIQGGAKAFVNVQHPFAIIMKNGKILGRFRNGYLTTDNPELIAILTKPTQRYVKVLDIGAA